MKHLKKGRKLGRKKGPREAMLKMLVGELLNRGKITTTEAKAKELKGITEKIIGRAKLVLSQDKNVSLSALRFVMAHVPKNVTPGKIKELAKNFSERKSGYIRVLKFRQRKSDGAKMAVIELIKDKIKA
jgi:large subunit ribosomal protein L17